MVGLLGRGNARQVLGRFGPCGGSNLDTLENLEWGLNEMDEGNVPWLITDLKEMKAWGDRHLVGVDLLEVSSEN